ncbi:hypothetical protein [Marisediminicola sp. LYQ85]|uniref:hypothetical protein n=1 Tax=Marisediminicola sp. LYQ85 TaxID=3391062 RepID=UPI003982E72C
MTDTTTRPATDVDVVRFIGKACAAAAPKVAYTAADLKWATTRLVDYAQPKVPVLTLKVVFHPRTIDTFITTALPGMAPTSCGNMRSILLRMSEVLLGERAPRVHLTPMSASDPSVPYAADEMKAFRAWASCAQAVRRINAGVLIALGFGAGLSGGEIADLRVGDVTADGGVVTVSVHGSRARRVVVDAAWSRLLAKGITDRDPAAYLFCADREGASKNLVNNFIARTRSSIPGPNSQRMRATWIVGHLNNATMPAVLLDQAGVRNLSALGRFMPFANAA